MSRFLIIPQRDNIKESLRLADEYGFGFEYNDFYCPDVLDDPSLADDIIAFYKRQPLPDVCTLHGAFFDVLVFSDDRLIREVSEKRIRTSLDIARKIGAKGAVFHTNHNPALTSQTYIDHWTQRNELFWRGVAEEYPDVNIYMENMFDNTPHILCGLAGKMADVSSFGICFDYAHAMIFGSDIDEWVCAVSPYVRHMHINDNDLKSDLHLAVGEGDIDWNAFSEHFKQSLSGSETVLIETSSIKNQISSARFLSKLGLI